MGKGRLENPERRIDIRFDRPIELLDRNVRYGFMALLSARIAYDNIEPAQIVCPNRRGSGIGSDFNNSIKSPDTVIYGRGTTRFT
jgi:hypothetical protein